MRDATKERERELSSDLEQARHPLARSLGGLAMTALGSLFLFTGALVADAEVLALS